MRFLLDHDVPAELARLLRTEGHSIQRVAEAMPPTAPDAAVLAFAHEHELLLVTCNRDDFLALAAHQPHSGIIVLIRRAKRVMECAAMLRLISSAGESGLRHNINFA